MEWPDDTVLWFLEDMKNTPELWDPHDPRYTRQGIKQDAWVRLGAKYKIGPVELKKKWQSLQASYRRERAKIKTGKDTVWFAFQTMSFLGMDIRKGPISAPNGSDGDTEGNLPFEESDSNDADLYNPTEVEMLTPTVTLTTPTCDVSLFQPTYNNNDFQPTYSNNSTSLLRTSLVESTQTPAVKRRRPSSESAEDSTLNDRLQEEQLETAGKNIIAKLRLLPKVQRIFAERLIYDVLLEAEMGSLKRTSKLEI